MSEVLAPVAEVSTLAAEPAQQPSAGEMLRQAREAAGLQLAALAVALNVPLKKLEALESNQLELLPDVVFVRALAASVCRTLKLDAGPVLARLPQTTVPRLKSAAQGINTPFRSPGDRVGGALWSQLSRPVVLVVLAFLLGALVLLFLPVMEWPAAVTPAAPTLPADAPAAAAAPGAVSTDVIAPSLAVSTGAPLNGMASAALVGGELSNALIVFKGRAPAWVEVTDARGVVQLRKTLLAGEAAGAAGALPLSVVVGRVDGTEVLVRGQPLDLLAVAKDNVARFEVK